MKHRLYVASVLVLIVALMTVVPASAGKPAKSLSVVVTPAVPDIGAQWSPSVTINWEGYRAYSVGYYFGWDDAQGDFHFDGTVKVPVDPKAKGLQTLTFEVPYTFIRGDNNPVCNIIYAGILYDAKDNVIVREDPYILNICIEPVP